MIMQYIFPTLFFFFYKISVLININFCIFEVTSSKCIDGSCEYVIGFHLFFCGGSVSRILMLYRVALDIFPLLMFFIM